MKITRTDNLHFQKILRAKCNVIKNGKMQPAEIYEIEPGKDRKYCNKIKRDNNWDTGIFIHSLLCAITEPIEDENSYVIEDKSNHKCIGYCIMDDESEAISYIETVPKDLTSYEYIGETLLTFLAKKTKAQNKPSLQVKNISIDALNFYTNCFFKITDENRRRASLENNFIELLEWQNSTHTGSEFDYLG